MAQALQAESMSYTWNITDPTFITQIKTAKFGQRFKSPIFSMFDLRWFCQLYPNGQHEQRRGTTTMFVFLIALSKNVESIRINRTFRFVELDITDRDRFMTVSHEEMHLSSWPAGTVKTQDIQQCTQFTFKVDVELHAVFDKDDNDITNCYLQNEKIKTDPTVSSQDLSLKTAVLDSIVMQIEQINTKISAMQQKINNIELRLNEEKKQDDFGDRLGKMMNDMKLMKQNINALSANNKMNPEQQKVKSWLENNVKLPQYFDTFMKNGIDELSVVALLDTATLKAIGIDVIGHQMKILNHAKQLHQNNPNEGDTAYM
eukprot:777829_1